MLRRLVPSVLLALACALVIGAAAPVAGALTRDAQLKQNVRLLQVYVERSAARTSFTYPAASIVKKGGGLRAPVWPANPWTGRPMAPGAARGAYTYTLAAGGASYAKGQVSWASLGAYVDLWPRNPWTNVAMVDAPTQGDFTYVQTQNGYTLTSHLKGGVAGDTVDNYYADHVLGVRDHLKNVYCQAAVQVIKDYIEAWKAANGGTPPTADQLTKTGAVGLVHAWWPVNPWYGSPMTNEDVKGAFQYTPGVGGAYTLTVRQQPDTYYAQYYTPE